MERKTGFRRSRSARSGPPVPVVSVPGQSRFRSPARLSVPRAVYLLKELAGFLGVLCVRVHACVRVRVLAASRWCRFIRGTAVCTSCALEAGSGCWTRFRFGYVATLLRVPGSFLAPPPVGRWWRLSAVSPTAAAQAPGVPGVVLRLPVLLSFSVGRRGAWSCGGRLSCRDPQSRRSVT